MDKHPYLFEQVLNLAQHFEDSGDADSLLIGHSLAKVAEIVMAAEKLERSECGWSKHEVIEMIAAYKKASQK